MIQEKPGESSMRWLLITKSTDSRASAGVSVGKSGNEVEVHTNTNTYALLNNSINDLKFNTFLHGIQHTLIVGLKTEYQLSTS